MRRSVLGLAAAGLMGSFAPVEAAEPVVTPPDQCSATAAEKRQLLDVIDGGTIRLEGGEILRLSGIDVPPVFRKDETDAGEAARRHLETLLGGSGAVLQLVPSGRDRHGRILGQLFDHAGSLLQAEMVSAGFARVRPYQAGVPCTERLLALEHAARAAGAGLWGKDFAVLAADDPSLIGRNGLYVIVEGFVLSVGQGNHVDFLNFGHFWQRDFTVLVSAPVAARFAENGMDTAALAERRVLVRGVIEESGGPTIRLNDFRELEILDDD